MYSVMKHDECVLNLSTVIHDLSCKGTFFKLHNLQLLIGCLLSSLPLRMLPKNCQMLLFSATFEETVWNFAQRIVPDPNVIKLKREEETLDTIKQYYVLCNCKEEKFHALCNIYGAITIAQAMIFCHVSSQRSLTLVFYSSRPQRPVVFPRVVV